MDEVSIASVQSDLLVSTTDYPLPTGWKLEARTGDAVRHYLAQSPDAASAIAAVRGQPGMSDTEITISGDVPLHELDWLYMADGEVKRLFKA